MSKSKQKRVEILKNEQITLWKSKEELIVIGQPSNKDDYYLMIGNTVIASFKTFEEAYNDSDKLNVERVSAIVHSLINMFIDNNKQKTTTK
jgi:heme oxygenase